MLLEANRCVSAMIRRSRPRQTRRADTVLRAQYGAAAEAPSRVVFVRVSARGIDAQGRRRAFLQRLTPLGDPCLSSNALLLAPCLSSNAPP